VASKSAAQKRVCKLKDDGGRRHGIHWQHYEWPSWEQLKGTGLRPEWMFINRGAKMMNNSKWMLLLPFAATAIPTIGHSQTLPGPYYDSVAKAWHGEIPAGQHRWPTIRPGSFADPTRPNNPYCSTVDGKRVCNMTLMMDEAEVEERGYIATDEQRAKGMTSYDVYKAAMCANQEAATGVPCLKPKPPER
jgi:hypothetical protein